jgi:hypothetical protein
MAQKINESSREVSPPTTRRSLLQLGAVAAGALSLLGLSGRRAEAKVSQAAVGYQASPKGAQNCANCRLFEPPNACKQVDGAVSPNGWCKIWSKAA